MTLSMPSLCPILGLCALSVDNDNGFIAYPGSNQVSTSSVGGTKCLFFTFALVVITSILGEGINYFHHFGSKGG